jgi:hypothetical protein
MRLIRTLKVCAGGVLILMAGAAIAGVWYLDQAGVAPRALARHITERIAGHDNDALVRRGEQWATDALLRLDRRGVEPIDAAGLTLGATARVRQMPAAKAMRQVAVSSAAELRLAINGAQPGDLIILAPGTYRFAGASVAARQPGSEGAPITVRGGGPAHVIIEFDAVEGFVVSAPYWRFEQLSIRGICRNDAECEHAFHVVGDAHHFAATDNTISDFNAHFKINGSGGHFPDHGTIQGNMLSNSAPRRTSNPVTPIDLVAASHWTIRRNLIADFIKQGGDQISYGAFAKGGGSNNTFEQNIVWCERLLQNQPGQRVGLSLGGGGSEAAYCREGKCITEQDDSVIASNLVASCSDDGVYLNRAARSKVFHNTLVGTAGIALRFPATSAEVEGNLVDGPIHARDGALLREVDNLATPVAYRYLGYHPNHGLFANKSGNSLAWSAPAPRRSPPVAAVPSDLCGGTRPAAPAYGAFEDFSACLRGAAGQ